LSVKQTTLIYDALTRETEVRELTSEEIKELQKSTIESQEIEESIDLKIAARKSALAKLAALGLTEEEIAAL
jgi:DNA-binding NarL/FixJ family response regulator